MAPTIRLSELEFIFAKMEQMFISKRIKKDESKISHTLLAEGENFYKKFKNLEKEKLNWHSFKEKCTFQLTLEHTEKLTLFRPQQRNETKSEIFSRILNLIDVIDIPWNIIITHLMYKVSQNTYESLRFCQNRIDIEAVAIESNLQQEEKKRRKSNKEAAEKRINSTTAKEQHRNTSQKQFQTPAKNNKQEQMQMNQMTLTTKSTQTDTVEINDQLIPVILDTGSDINIISSEVILQNTLPQFEIEKIIVTNIFNTKYELNKMTTVSYKIDGIWRTDDFYIYESANCQLIISAQTRKEHLENLKTLKEVQEKTNDVLNNESTGMIKHEMATIETKGDKIIRVAGKQWDRTTMNAIKEKTIEYLDKGFIRPSKSTWLNPIRPVEKPDGSTRFTINMFFLNKIVEKEAYSPPKMQEVIESMQGNNYLSVLDLKDGYFHIPLKESDRHKTACRIGNKLYEWCVLPQGYTNSTSIFQRAMDKILSAVDETAARAYIDDIVIGGKTKEDHDKNFLLVLQTLEKNGIRINKNKIQYRQKKTKLLGHFITGNTQQPDNKRFTKALSYASPRTKGELQRFLGFANGYNRYIKEYAGIASPLFDLLQKKTKFIWEEKHENAFENLLASIQKNVITNIVRKDGDFVLETDASLVAFGAVLKQKQDGKLVTNWASKKLSAHDNKLPITEREYLAAAWAIKHFDYYLRGTNFTLITDHNALTYFNSKEALATAKLERIRSSLTEYNFTIEYKKGKELIEADALSRQYETKPQETTSEEAIKTIKDEHENNSHKGVKTMYYKLKRLYDIPNLWAKCKEIVSNCNICQKNKIKTNGGSIFITTTKPLEKIAIDTYFYSMQDKALLIKDYYTRKAWIHILKKKEQTEITEAMEKFIKEIGTPETIVFDQGKEFNNALFNDFLNTHKINRHMIAHENHRANGRIERLNRDINLAMRKANTENNKQNWTETVTKFITNYNNSYHRGIEMTPNEAFANPTDNKLQQLNSNESRYATEFTIGNKEKFKINDDICVKTKEVEIHNKEKPLYDKQGTVIEALENDGYLVQMTETGKIKKVAHKNLTKIFAQNNDIDRKNTANSDDNGRTNNTDNTANSSSKIKQNDAVRTTENGHNHEQFNHGSLEMAGGQQHKQLQRVDIENKRTRNKFRGFKQRIDGTSSTKNDRGDATRIHNQNDNQNEEKLQATGKNNNLNNSNPVLDNKDGFSSRTEDSSDTRRTSTESELPGFNDAEGNTKEKEILHKMQQDRTLSHHMPNTK